MAVREALQGLLDVREACKGLFLSGTPDKVVWLSGRRKNIKKKSSNTS